MAYDSNDHIRRVKHIIFNTRHHLVSTETPLLFNLPLRISSSNCALEVPLTHTQKKLGFEVLVKYIPKIYVGE